ncbi:MAG: CoA-binding protein [Bacteroidia bacterium]
MHNSSSITLILGASTNPDRYSFIAARRLLAAGHEIAMVGKSGGEIAGNPILKDVEEITNQVDTITLYLNPAHQVPYYDAIIRLSPRRIIFNPGTENPELERMAAKNNIEILNACTLVLLSTNSY